MSLEVKDIPAKIIPLLQQAKQYALFSFVVLVLLLAGFLVFRVNQLSSSEPTDTDVDTQLQQVPRPRVDEDIVQKILDLRDQNVQVEALFKQARNNPFAE